jgi:hypothetical protein
MVNGMQFENPQENGMNNKDSFKTVVCPEYDGFILESQGALDDLRVRRDELVALGLNDGKIPTVLLRSQTDYTKAHSLLEGGEQVGPTYPAGSHFMLEAKLSDLEKSREILLGHVNTLQRETDHLLSLALELPPDTRWEFEKVHLSVSNVLSAMRKDINGI